MAAALTRADYDDVAALERFGEGVDVATYEFENVPVGPLKVLGEKLRPGTKSLAIAQDRAVEKEFIEQTGAKVAPWRAVSSLEEVQAAVAELGAPLVLKTRRYGYDGKGQAWIRHPSEAEAAWEAIGRHAAILEGFVAFEHEFSVILVRGIDGEIRYWDSTVNVHEGGILATASAPASAVRAPKMSRERTSRPFLSAPSRYSRPGGARLSASSPSSGSFGASNGAKTITTSRITTTVAPIIAFGFRRIRQSSMFHDDGVAAAVPSNTPWTASAATCVS